MRRTPAADGRKSGLRIPGSGGARRGLALLLATWLAPAVARGGGFEYGANGAVAVGRAGAFVARGDDPSTLYYNVAGMGRMESGTHVLLDCNLILRTLTFRREGTMDFASSNGFAVNGQPFPGIEDATGLYPAPFLGIVTDLGFDSGFVFGFGAFGPAAIGRADYPTQLWATGNDGERRLIPGPQRYDVLDMDIVFLWPTLAAAYRVGDNLAFGVGFQPGFVNLVFQHIAVAWVTRNVMADIRANLDAWDPFVPGGLFGIWYRPFRHLELALSTRVSAGIDAHGDLVTVSNPYGVDGQDPVASNQLPDEHWSGYDGASGERPPSASLAFEWPAMVVRYGIRFVWPRDTGDVVGGALDPEIDRRLARLPPHRREWFDIELDVTYEMDSTLREFRIKVDGVIPTGYGAPNFPVRPTGDPDTAGMLVVPHRWKDVVGFRLGGDVNFLDGDLSLHWGTMFETSTVPEPMTRLDYAHWTTFGVSTGVTVRLPWWGMELTASYMHLFMPDRDVKDGDVRMLSAVSTDETRIPTINNGAYRSAMDIFAFGANASF